jgi:DNA-binding Xre family transcriptional regulator
MLTYNLTRLFKLRGIIRPLTFLMEKGFTRDLASRITTDVNLKLKIENIEKLCKTLNCTPNDLMEWKPDIDSEDVPSNPLFALKRSESKFDISSLVKDVPVDKLEELQKEILNAVEKAKKNN